MAGLYLRICVLICTTSFLAASAALAGPPDYDLTREAGDITGTITVCDAPASGVLVYAPGTSFSAISNASGGFKISYVQQGTYDLVVRKDGSPIGSITQVLVVKKQTTEIGTHDFCTDSDNDGFYAWEDCNDNNPAIYPGAQEQCGDGIDNNCNGLIDEGCPECTDIDLDGFSPQVGCGDAVDCNDQDAAINPDATELCDDIDNNCDGQVDESGPNQTYFYLDNDSDGFGGLDGAVLACDAPGAAYTDIGGDCDDNNAAIYPGALEECDGFDNDCNGVTDDNLPVQLCENQEGVCSGSTKQCNGVLGWSECDYSVYSDAYEISETLCDGLDNDCDAVVDEESCGSPQGTSCLTNFECISGNCVDGVCCESACTGVCQTCSGLYGGTAGTCTLIPAELDPDAECPGGSCDGNGQCSVP